jgi:hypothetical protein
MKTTKKYGKKIDIALSMWVKLARAHDTFNHLTAANIHTFGLTPRQRRQYDGCCRQPGKSRYSRTDR